MIRHAARYAVDYLLGCTPRQVARRARKAREAGPGFTTRRQAADVFADVTHRLADPDRDPALDGELLERARAALRFLTSS